MTEEIDFIQRYGKSKGWELKPRTVLVEGTTDVDIFHLTALLKLEHDGHDLLEGLAIVAAGERDRGGIYGVIRELIVLRNSARVCLSPKGRSIYRFIGLFDNDPAGRRAIKEAPKLDTAILEYRDIFRIHPVMTAKGNLEPNTLKKTFERENAAYKGMDWEIEDLLPNNFFAAFLEEHSNVVKKKIERSDKTHRELTRDGKAHLNRFIRNHAIYEDLQEVAKVLQALRFYMLLNP